MKNKYLVILFFIFLGIGFYFLNFHTPIMHDDIAYLFKYGPSSNERPTAVPIKTITDIFESQYYHYLDVNGRAPLHFLIQFFLLLGKGFFNIFNALAFLGLIVFLYKMIVLPSLNDLEKLVLLTFISVSIWFTSPFIGLTMLWLTGAVNYLWGTLAVFSFLYFLNKKTASLSFNFFKLTGVFLLSVIAGWTQESLSIGVSAALFFYFVGNRSQLTFKNSCMIVGFWLGTSLIIVAPGTLNRVDNEIGINQLGFFEVIVAKLIIVFGILKILKVNLLILVVLMVGNYLKGAKFISLLKKRALFIYAIIFCLLFIIVLGKLDERIFFGVNMLLILINAGLAVGLISTMSKMVLKGVSIVFLIGICYSFYQAINSCKEYELVYFNVIKKIKESKEGIVAMPPIPKSRFVYNTLNGIKDSENFHNRVLGFYLDVPKVTILPLNIYNNFIPENTICTSKNINETWTVPLYWNKNFNFLVVDITNISFNTEFKPFTQFEYYKSDVEQLKPHQLFIRNILGTLKGKKEVRKSYILKINKRHLLLIDKSGIDLNSVAKIEIKNKEDANLIFEIKKK